MTKLLQDKVCLVTGGSRGLGRAICVAFAREGARLVAFAYARDEQSAAETSALIAELGAKPLAIRADVRDRSAVVAMVKQVEKESGGAIDVLVNNAGHGQVVPVALMEEEDWDRMLDTHVKGAFLVSQAAMRGMIAAKKGRILNVGSLAGTKMMQAPVHYSTAKAALKGFTEALAKEIGRYGVTVNCLAPGILEEGVAGNLPQARLDDYLRHCALGRVGRFDEVAAVAAMIASDRNGYMNGATIVLDGAV